jgi:hypothetical protein
MRAEQASEAAKEGEALLARVETAIRTDGVSAQLASCHVAIFACLCLDEKGGGCLVSSPVRAACRDGSVANRVTSHARCRPGMWWTGSSSPSTRGEPGVSILEAVHFD